MEPRRCCRSLPTQSRSLPLHSPTFISPPSTSFSLILCAPHFPSHTSSIVVYTPELVPMSSTEDPYAPEGDPRLLPVPLATTSVWQQSVALDPLILTNSTTSLPESADIVIVGGGLCGALLAWELLQQTSGNVVLLEARELASGASGRNAGHCRPDAGRGFGMFAKVHGEEQAKAILNSERTVFERYVSSPLSHRIRS